MKKLNRTATAVVAAAVASSAVLASVPAEAAQAAQGKRSLAKVLAADGTSFDKNWDDFDITEAAVLAVLDAKPGSAVKLLTQGGKRATAFIPTDRAFRRLVGDLVGSKPGSEGKTFQAVAGLGIDTVESVLLYHVVAGKTLVSEKVVAARGTAVETASGGSVTVRINHEGDIRLEDNDPNDINARVIPAALDINRGNRQVAHGITRVLRPADL
ncbi:fasciclin domain-containing protein [Nocardioides dongxiaopingii]|uniref:fasciclin domain-containing protein n=1 Tax=Nocardioides TaxID=1839 RepID=UPI0010C76FF2|nr:MULTISPECIES: fasciclin domain-containing protein [Nocardioides]QCW49559.1 fasciclin domain-containing protein [Nocardioides sp. S-1144]